jgi:hypothetical protein
VFDSDGDASIIDIHDGDVSDECPDVAAAAMPAITSYASETEVSAQESDQESLPVVFSIASPMEKINKCLPNLIAGLLASEPPSMDSMTDRIIFTPAPISDESHVVYHASAMSAEGLMNAEGGDPTLRDDIRSIPKFDARNGGLPDADRKQGGMRKTVVADQDQRVRNQRLQLLRWSNATPDIITGQGRDGTRGLYRLVSACPDVALASLESRKSFLNMLLPLGRRLLPSDWKPYLRISYHGSTRSRVESRFQWILI